MNVRPSVSIIKAGPRSCVPCHNCYAPHFMELFAKAAKENPAWTCYWFCCNMESGNCAGNVIRGKAMSFALRKRLPGRKDLNDQSSAANIKKVLHEYRHTPAGCSWQLQVRRIDGEIPSTRRKRKAGLAARSEPVSRRRAGGNQEAHCLCFDSQRERWEGQSNTNQI